MAAGAVIVVYILYAVFAEWRGLARMHFVGYDYAFFYYAFQSVLHHQTAWSHLYNLPLQQAWPAHHGFPLKPNNQYVYPPQFACLFSFFGLLPFALSAALWMLMSAILYFCAMFWLIRMLWQKIRRVHLLAVFVIAIALTPFEMDVGVGNVNTLLFAAISLTFYLRYHRNKAGWAGIPIGIAVLLKVTPAAILLIFLLRKEWRLLKSASAVMILGTICTALFTGIGPMTEYVVRFSSFGQTSMRNGPAPYNQSIFGVLGMLNEHHWLSLSSGVQYWAYVLFVVFVAWKIYSTLQGKILGRLKRNAGTGAGARAGASAHPVHVPRFEWQKGGPVAWIADWRLDIALAALTPLLFSPLVEENHMVYAFPVLVVFVRIAHDAYTQRTKAGLRRGAILLGITLISIVLLSLPATFALNFIVAHQPGLFFVQIQMFVVLITLFLTTLWVYRHPIEMRYRDLPSGHMVQ